MRGKRFRQTIRLYTMLGVGKRTQYLKKNNIFASMGEDCSIMDRKVPLYANLISIGNNVHVASKVAFITHDIIHVMLNNSRVQGARGGGTAKENIGCIEIGDNVFIGSNTVILNDVRIGSNVIIAAGTLVNKDIPDNVVVAGVPAKEIDTFEHFYQKRVEKSTYPDRFRVHREEVDDEFAEWCWKEFRKKRSK